MRGPRPLNVKPNPAEVGGKVTIEGNAGQKIYIGYKGTIQQVRLDAHGELEFDVPGKAEEQFTVSDGNAKPQNVIVDIISNGK